MTTAPVMKELMFGCTLFLIIHDLSLAIQSQRHLNYQPQIQHYQSMSSTALGFPKDKRVTRHCSILAPKAVGPKGCCHLDLNQSTAQIATLWEEILAGRKFGGFGRI